MEQLQSYWYTWGAFVAFGIALIAALWVFIDAYRKEEDAVVWKMLVVLPVVLILPSIFLALIQDLQRALANALLPLALLGIGAVLIALFAWMMELIGVGSNVKMRCANCHRPRDPSWPYCPYCEYDKPRDDAPQPSTVGANIPPPPVQIPPPLAAMPPTPIQVSLSPAEEIHESKTISVEPSKTISLDHDAGATRMLQIEPALLAYLTILTGAHEGKTIQLKETTNIGREAEGNDIVLDDDSVSRQHAKVRFQDGKFALTDMGSSNGTFIEDAKTGEWKKIQYRILTDGTKIKVGETVLRFMQVEKSDE